MVNLWELRLQLPWALSSLFEWNINRAYEEHAGDVVSLLKDLGVPTTDRDISGMTPQDLSPGIEF